MNKTPIVLIGMIVVVLAAACSSTGITRTKDSVGTRKVSTAEATVVEIDQEQRTAVLKDANGTLQYIKLSADAKNLDQVKAGDKVIAEVIESVEVVVRESSEEPSSDVFESVQQDPLRPGAQKVVVSETTARVEKIDYESRIITLSGKNGKRLTTQAGPEVKRFNEIKQGDIISMRIVKETIIRVESR